MEAALKKVYRLQPELVRGSGGVFDVIIDGETVFSKWEEHRFPSNEEVLALIARRTKAG